LIVKYNSMSSRITDVSVLESASSFVRYYLRQNSILRESNNSLSAQLNNVINSLNGEDGLLDKAGFGHLEVSNESNFSELVSESSVHLYSFEIIIRDTRNGKEETAYVIIPVG